MRRQTVLLRRQPKRATGRQPRRSNKPKRTTKRRRVTRGKTNNQPIARAYVSGTNSGRTQTLKGSEFLISINVPTNEESGNLLWDTKLAPRLFEGTRLFQTSQLWDMYQVKSFQLEITTAAPTTVAGSYIACIDPSPETEYIDYSGSQLVRVMSNTPGSRNASLSTSMAGRSMINLLSRPKEWLYTDLTTQDVYKTHFGAAALAIYAKTGGYTGDVSLTIKIHYDITFRAPSLSFGGNPGQTTTTWHAAYPGSIGWLPVGTNPYNAAEASWHVPEAAFPSNIPESGSVWQLQNVTLSAPGYYGEFMALNSASTFFRSNTGYSNYIAMTMHPTLEDARLAVNAIQWSAFKLALESLGMPVGAPETLSAPWYNNFELASPIVPAARSNTQKTVTQLTQMVAMLSNDLSQLRLSSHSQQSQPSKVASSPPLELSEKLPSSRTSTQSRSLTTSTQVPSQSRDTSEFPTTSGFLSRLSASDQAKITLPKPKPDSEFQRELFGDSDSESDEDYTMEMIREVRAANHLPPSLSAELNHVERNATKREKMRLLFTIAQQLQGELFGSDDETDSDEDDQDPEHPTDGAPEAPV